MMRGKPVGSHQRIGSFQSFSFLEEPLLNAVASPVFVFRNFSKAHGVICGRLLLVAFKAPRASPALVMSQNPDRSCGSNALPAVAALPCANSGIPTARRLSVIKTKKAASLRLIQYLNGCSPGFR